MARSMHAKSRNCTPIPARHGRSRCRRPPLRGHRLLAHVVGHGQPARPAEAPEPEAACCRIAVDGGQHVGQRLAVGVRHGARGLQLLERLPGDAPPLVSPEHRSTHHLHDVLGEDAPHHGQLGSVGGIVEQVELRLHSPAEEGLPRGVSEPPRHHDRHRGLPLAHRLGHRRGCRRNRQRLVLGEAAADRGGDRAPVVVDDADGDARRLAVLVAGEDEPENDAMATGRRSS